MSAPVDSFHPLLRLLHGLMALLVIAMLFVGVVMVASVDGSQPLLVAWHKQLGLALLVLLLARCHTTPTSSVVTRPRLRKFLQDVARYCA
ncbi:cytochrome b/b6 domain-containing protein [Pseudomonas sp. ZM24]|uniref:cytochrome b/b6 domain-containing protein n=1 Tax=Pseudomonas triclosanedens TaxID=2961893 RepID=UPI0020C2BACD|nr:cytochrome b/b6 domain-containing protein [Pseudomonas triclosanedens]MCP8478395.1 cytochrome b/b6 domain-containing protein [Pseudomonas triclosanedens]